MRIKFDNVDLVRLTNELKRLNSVAFDAVETKELTEMLDRARNEDKKNGGTPKKTGELRISSDKSPHEMGYRKEYAPHVEYGHRTVNGGYVKGQRFLKKNVDIQREIYKKDLIKALRGDFDV